MLWENFLENFLSDVLTVVLFGGGTYLLFHKKINQKISQISNNNQNIVAQRIEKINGDKIIQKGEKNIMIKETEKSTTDTPKLTKKVTEYYE
ncbi:MAG TPA: hypothetical protein DHS57_02730 [Erysipelotrichaceae bacterium]|jgi:hypothetical protein|nr:hypothetical protein [Erysipelotrichaceae bacterium]